MKKTMFERSAIISFFSVLLILFLFSNYASGQVLDSSDYIIGPKDLLEIKVFGQDELDTTVRVSEDGKITMSLLGEVDVQGLTKSGVERKLAQLFEEKYLHNPQVTIFIKEYQSNRVSVLGAVSNPGYYELLGRQTILQVISQAGGMTEDAGEEIIVIRQQGDGSNTALKISIEDLAVKGDVELNIFLEPGDIVNIPIDKTVHVYVFGQVRNPGALDVKRSKIPTLLQAIAQAGGFSERASKSGVVRKRKSDDDKETQIKVNVKSIIKGKKKDIQLLENDVVYVPESIF